MLEYPLSVVFTGDRVGQDNLVDEFADSPLEAPVTFAIIRTGEAKARATTAPHGVLGWESESAASGLICGFLPLRVSICKCGSVPSLLKLRVRRSYVRVLLSALQGVMMMDWK